MALTLNKKLVGGFMAVATTGLIIGLVGLVGLRESTKALGEIRSEIMDRGQFLVKATDLARSAQVNFKIQVQEWKNTLLRGNDPAQLDKYWNGFERQEAEVQANLEELIELLARYDVPNESVVAAARTHLGLGERYRDAIRGYDSEDPEAHRKVDALVKGVDRAPTQEIDAIVALVHSFEAAGAEEREAAFSARAKSLKAITTVTMLIGVGGAIALGLWLGGSISRQIKRIARDLREGAEVVDGAAGEVSRYGQSLADSTNREAASIQEASASLEVLADNTRENSQAAQTATDIANQTRRAVRDGKQHMDEMERAMSAIRESSDGISQILKSIDEIAFQTNILALNAAVEAARAGDAGQGFAVVADEVRNLAQRSAKAAQETSSRIEDSIEKSRRGVDISAKVSRSLDEILGKAAELDELVAKIASSADQNRDGVEQVNSAIRSIENSYQSNAAITEESAAAAQELSHQAVSLNRSIHDLSIMVGNATQERAKRSGSPPRHAPSRRSTSDWKQADAERSKAKRTEESEVTLWN